MSAHKKSAASARATLPVAQLAKLVAELQQAVAPFTVTLSPLERQRLPKPRPSFDRVVHDMAALVDRFAVALPGTSVAAMRADADRARELASLLPELAALHQAIENTVLAARSNAWRQAIAYYSALRGLGELDPVVSRALAPIRDTFALRGRKAASSAPPPPMPAIAAQPEAAHAG
jgi:hypothetical protein